MRSREFGFLRLLTLIGLVSCFVPSGAQTSDKVPSDDKPVEAYYLFRPNSSYCHKSPCSSGFVKLVNHMTTPCRGGKPQRECYVAEVDYSRLSLSDMEYDRLLQAVEAGNVLFEGRIVPGGSPGLRTSRHFEVSQAWIAASDKTATGTYYQVTSSNIHCISPLCPAYHEAELNDVWQRYIDDVVLTLTGASGQQIKEAYEAMADPEGVIVVGVHTTKRGSGDKAKVLVGSQFYLRVVPNPCQPTGCGGAALRRDRDGDDL